ncbi:hypothetical protein FSARC_8801 [Fusarium sarcochroum]|uniref:Amidoligase n=1 Tax=Fusarium sarcochroum TaxID=1208366 RepID=A0A8H4TSD9_9HYPO|nr:hypothetical protein FSARC_8801 [Fusarium sarcochroum]
MTKEPLTSSQEAGTETNTQPTREEKGKMPAKEHLEAKADNSEQEDKYTRPPRISFGVELEFLVPRRPKGTESDDKIPGIAPVTDENSGIAAVAKLLTKHGIYAKEQWIHESSKEGSAELPWIIKTDGSVDESGDRHQPSHYEAWDAVEVASPPMYACDEAYKLVSAVVRLLTTNLRARVNETCGLHVHVGNGPHQMDMRALRNYAALQWASEPVMSTLHCPTRSFARWTKSIRRCKGIRLTEGVTAELARHETFQDPRFIPRYVGRARKFGEAPVASRAKLRQHVQQMQQEERGTGRHYEPDWDSDDSDWEFWESEPFERPRKACQQRRQISAVPFENFLGPSANDAQLDSESTRRELPPQISFPVSELVMTDTSSGSSSLLDEKRTKRKDISAQELLTNEDLHFDRYPQAMDINTRAHVANTNLTWKAVAELLACDVGVHQIAFLMSEYDKGYTSNWEGQQKQELQPKGVKNYHGTVESRLAGGSLDAEWIAIWIKIQCRMLEWARDAEPSQLMRVIGKLSRDDHSNECTYDVLDFLRDLGLFTEIKYCQERLRRGEEAWFECILMSTDWTPEGLKDYVDIPSMAGGGSEDGVVWGWNPIVSPQAENYIHWGQSPSNEQFNWGEDLGESEDAPTQPRDLVWSPESGIVE